MKPDWDKLIADYEDHAEILVADVDCTADGKAMCLELGVRGYPTIKYGDPHNLQDYRGARDFDTLKKFAEGLGPMCSPVKLDVCDDAKRKEIEEYKALGSSGREALIKQKEDEMTKLEEDFKMFVDNLTKTYDKATETKEKQVETIMVDKLGLLKAVQAYEQKKRKKQKAKSDL